MRLYCNKQLETTFHNFVKNRRISPLTRDRNNEHIMSSDRWWQNGRRVKVGVCPRWPSLGLSHWASSAAAACSYQRYAGSLQRTQQLTTYTQGVPINQPHNQLSIKCIYEPYVFSHSVAMSSAECTPFSLVCGQLLTVCDVIWHLRQGHMSVVEKPHFFRQDAQWPLLVWSNLEVPNKHITSLATSHSTLHTHLQL